MKSCLLWHCILCQNSKWEYILFVLFFADFPVARLSHLDMVGAGLLHLENNIVSSAPIESARFMNNKITHIEADAFRYAHFPPQHAKEQSLIIIFFKLLGEALSG